MEDIIKKIDLLMDNIGSDTNKKKLPELSREIIKLSAIYGDAKRNFIKAKNHYDRELLMKKEQTRQTLEKIEEEKQRQDPKYKKARITAVEIETLSELELMKIKQLIEEPQMIQSYLEPLLKSYQDWVNSVKFTAKEMIQGEKLYP